MTEKRFYCDDELSKRDYAIFDLSKSDKSFNDFKDGEEFVELWRFDCYLCDETNSLMTGEEVVNKLNELYDENQRLKLENDGLRYVLKNIKRIDVEIDIDDINDRK